MTAWSNFDRFRCFPLHRGTPYQKWKLRPGFDVETLLKIPQKKSREPRVISVAHSRASATRARPPQHAVMRPRSVGSANAGRIMYPDPRRNPRCPPSWAVVVESSSGQMAHRLSPTTARPQGNTCEPRERANSWPQGARRCKRHCSAAWNAACKGIVSLRSAWILRCVASRYSAAWSRGLHVISGILGFGAPARSITRRAGAVAPLAIANMGMLPAKCLKAILLWRDIPFDDSKNWTDFTLRVVDTPQGERDLVVMYRRPHSRW